MDNFIPEITLKKLIDYFLSSLTEDYLYSLFGSIELNGYRFFDEARHIFLSSDDYPRKVKSNIFFNRDRAQEPTIHIGMPGETPGKADGIGFDPGILEGGGLVGGQYRESYTRTYSTRHSIVFTSSNTFEVLIMYYALKAFFQGNFILLEENGFKNPSFSGEDIILGSDIIPEPIYSRRLLIDSFQEFEAPSIEVKDSVTEINFINNCSNRRE